MTEPLTDPNLSKALYGLVSVLFTNLVVGWEKGILAKHTLFRQLIAETQFISKNIEGNAVRIEQDRDDDKTFLLLTKLRLPIHYAKIADIIIHEELGKSASQFLSHCEHYNRIIELGERDGKKAQRKKEVLDQGSLLHNKPVRLYEDRGNGNKIVHVAQAERYLQELRRCSNRYLRFAKWFPWYLIILWSEKPDTGATVNEA